jgi:hypothetical protein
MSRDAAEYAVNGTAAAMIFAAARADRQNFQHHMNQRAVLRVRRQRYWHCALGAAQTGVRSGGIRVFHWSDE